jgi:hypothetical protein
MVSEIASVIEMDAVRLDIGKTSHQHPTLGQSIGMAAEMAHVSCTDVPPTRKLTKHLRHLPDHSAAAAAPNASGVKPKLCDTSHPVPCIGNRCWRSIRSEQALDMAVGVHADIGGRRHFGQAGHGHDVAGAKRAR